MKNVLITGATGGIGFALVDAFYKNEFNLFVTGSNNEKLQSIKSKYSKNLEVCVCDLSKDKEINKLMKKAEEYFGVVDILVNNAGITKDNLLLSNGTVKIAVLWNRNEFTIDGYNFFFELVLKISSTNNNSEVLILVL